MDVVKCSAIQVAFILATDALIVVQGSQPVLSHNNVLVPPATVTPRQSQISSHGNRRSAPVIPIGNRCELYKGGPLCEPWLRNKTVFVDYRYPQEVVDSYARQITVGLMPFIDRNQFPPACDIVVQEGICRYLYPNCTTTQSGAIERARLCGESCQKIMDPQNPCKDSVLHLIGVGVLRVPRVFQEFAAVHVYLPSFSCDPKQLPTAGPGISCLDLVENLPSSLEPPTVDHKQLRTCDGTANNSYCSFPFTYNGIGYENCTLVNSFESWRPWCKTEQGDSDIDDSYRWGYCDCQGNTTTVLLEAKCEMYNGGPVCLPYLNGTVVFSDHQYKQTYLGNLMDQFNNSFYASHKNSRCFLPSLQGLCYLMFPGCRKSLSSPFAVPQLLCSGTCTRLRDGTCGSDFSHLLHMVGNRFQSNKLNPVHFFAGRSICSRLPRKSNATENCKDATIARPSPTSSPTSLPGSDSIMIISVISVVCVVLITLGVVLAWLWRRAMEQSGNVIELEAKIPVRQKAVWDDDVAQAIRENLIRGKRLKVTEQIGEGNFGRVYKGTLDGETTVAVKSLKSGPHGGVDCQTANSFVREAMRMKNLDHLNVMTLMGICWGTEVCSDNFVQLGCWPLIVLPYTELGDLLGYIRKKRHQAARTASTDTMVTTVADDTIDEDHRDSPFSDDHKENAIKEDHEESPIPFDQLLKFGYQIAKGMDYVSSQGIVHRDLAARNCMLTWDMKVKVSDFGLARVLEEGKDYYRMGHGCALPVRWMALESLIDFVFTTESDIWSYGVTLWEIFSLCVVPYAGLSNSDVLPYVQRGGRLEKPAICSDSIYDLMHRCWMGNVGNRPKFGEIVAALDEHLSDGRNYLELQPDSEGEHIEDE